MSKKSDNYHSYSDIEPSMIKRMADNRLIKIDTSRCEMSQDDFESFLVYLEQIPGFHFMINDAFLLNTVPDDEEKK